MSCTEQTEYEYDNECCTKVCHQEFNAFVPVSIRPYVNAGKPEARCAGEAQIFPGFKKCGNDQKCFEFTVAQEIDVDIPIKYGAVMGYGKVCLENAVITAVEHENDDDCGCGHARTRARKNELKFDCGEI